MKVALVHDYIKEYGGAERVLEALHDLYPDATVFTSVYFPQYLGPHEKRFKNWDIKTSFIQILPFAERLISPIRVISPFLFKQFSFKDFDVVIVSATGAYISNAISNKPLHICYCHTPPRYLYGYETVREWKKHWFWNIVGTLANHFLRIADFNASQQVDFFIANSQEVASRIDKFYRREATVIYPPVEIPGIEYTVSSIKQTKKNSLNTKYLIPNTGYYLAGGRLARPKHIDLIIKTCTKYKLPLKVFGKEFAGYGEELKQLAGKNVEFVGEVADTEKYVLMQKAKAFLFASTDEDFGITPVEAMACGTPVVAFKGGGVLETVMEGRTGVFFEELTEESLYAAIKKLEKTKIKSADCRNHAEKFSKERFKKEIETFVQSKLNKSL